MPQLNVYANAYALIIGVGAYHHINRLHKTTTDAQDLHAVLRQQGYPASNVVMLLDDEATKFAISDKFDWLARRTDPDSTVLIFFAGHGAQRVGGFEPGEYLCPVEADWYNLRNTTISKDELTTALGAIPSERLVVLLDACHSGGMGQARGALAMQGLKEGLSEQTYSQLSAGEGRVVIASCRPDEVSWELDDMRNGLFSHYLLAGLRGEAADRDGAVRALPLFSYLSRQVSQHPSPQPQNPLLKTETSGDIILCQTAPVVDEPEALTPSTPESVPEPQPTPPTAPQPSARERPEPQPVISSPSTPQPTPPAQPKWRTSLWFISGAIGLGLMVTIGVCGVLAVMSGLIDLSALVPAELTATATPTVIPTLVPGTTPVPGTTQTRPTDGMTMVYVPAGEFLMGSADDDPQAEDDEKPQHRVSLDAFWIDRTEVTNAQYQRCVDARQCRESRFASNTVYNGAEYPVVGVSWEDARTYCEWAGGQLPTEKEWEYAARGPESLIYPWGDEFDAAKGSFFGSTDGYEYTAPVGSHPDGASWVGAEDMAGNVWEWVQSKYKDYPYQVDDGREDLEGTDVRRVLRGGGWVDGERSLRAADRLRLTVALRNRDIGFRCVLPAGREFPEIAELNVTATMTSMPEPLPSATPAAIVTPSPEPTATHTPTNTPVPRTTQTRLADGMTMVYVPAGEFLMGSADDDPQASDAEKPQHPVRVDAFWIDRTEVSVSQFRGFVEATGYQTSAEKDGFSWVYDGNTWNQTTGADWQHPFGPDSTAVDSHPVTQVSWDDAVAYCEWVGGRLPTEAEWEYAARGPESLVYPWGDEFEEAKGVFVGGEDGYDQTASVGSYPSGASWVGAQDMAGNVWEWVQDWYGDYPLAAETLVNPTGPKSGSQRVLRGGSWVSSERNVRAAVRDGHDIIISYRDFYIGFRCVLPADQEFPEIAELNVTAISIPTPISTATMTSTPDPLPSDTSTATQTLTDTQTSIPPTPTATLTLGLGATQTRPIDSMTMVYVPAGEFLMGSTDDDPQASDDEKPQHTVRVDAFWIDRTEVSVNQFRKFVEATGYQTTAERDGWSWVNNTPNYEWVETDGADWQHPFGPDSAGIDTHPVTQVGWEDAGAYCEWAGGRLPTEAEWEYAARGPESLIYPWGHEFEGNTANFCDKNCDFFWKNESVNDGYGQTAPVGSYPAGASWIGAQDMAGNVSEWTQSAYRAYPYATDDGREALDSVDVRVLRGGGWPHDVMWSLRTASRSRDTVSLSNDIIGFRCVLPADREFPEIAELNVTATLTSTPEPLPSDTPTATVTPSPEPTATYTPTNTQIPVPPTPSSTPTNTPAPGTTLTRFDDGMTMLYVPAGEFLMGSADDDPQAADSEKPQHRVSLDAFWIDRTEVTNAQYRQCVDSGLCEESSFADVKNYNSETYPVVGVGWNDAVTYCNWAGGRLPTEAEWEYAARGPESLVYPWGNVFDGTKT